MTVDQLMRLLKGLDADNEVRVLVDGKLVAVAAVGVNVEHRNIDRYSYQQFGEPVSDIHRAVIHLDVQP